MFPQVVIHCVVCLEQMFRQFNILKYPVKVGIDNVGDFGGLETLWMFLLRLAELLLLTFC